MVIIKKGRKHSHMPRHLKICFSRNATTPIALFIRDHSHCLSLRFYRCVKSTNFPVLHRITREPPLTLGTNFPSNFTPTRIEKSRKKLSRILYTYKFNVPAKWWRDEETFKPAKLSRQKKLR